MLDSDVAMLYQYTTKRINETVRRNINRFPEKFCFQLNEIEIENLRLQIATASKVFENKFRNKKFLPYAFDELQKKERKEFKQKIFFNGQIYDAYSLIIDIIKRAKNKILIIDNYIDDSILKMLQKKNKDVEVVILTSQQNQLTKLDIQKFNKQYPTLKLAVTNKFHDRFIVIDNKELYHCRCISKRLRKEMFCNFKDRRYGICRENKQY